MPLVTVKVPASSLKGVFSSGDGVEAGQPRALQVAHDFADVEADDGAVGAGYLHLAVERFDDLPL